MKKTSIVALMALLACLWLAAGCGDGECQACADSNCGACSDVPVCGDHSSGDDSVLDTGIDSNGVDMVQGDLIQPDYVIDTDAGDDANAVDVVVPNDFLTGTGRIQGQAFRRDMENHGGIDVFLVHADLDSRVYAFTKTDAGGNYVIDGVPAGSYRVSASVGEFSGNGPALSQKFVVSEGGTSSPDDLYLSVRGSIAGIALRGPRGADHSGSIVYLPDFNRQVETDFYGAFRLVGLTPGEYDICIAADGFVAVCHENVQVLPEQVADLGTSTLKLVDPENPVPARVVGRVILVGQADNSGVQIRLDAPDGPVVATTDADGYYSFDIESQTVDFNLDVPDGLGFEDVPDLQTWDLWAGVTTTMCPIHVGRGRSLYLNVSDPDVVVAFSPDSKTLYSSQNNALTMYSIEDGSNSWAYMYGRDFVFSPDSGVIATANLGEYSYLYFLEVGKLASEEVRPRYVATGEFNHVEFTPDSSMMVFSMASSFEQDYAYETYVTDIETGASRLLCQGDGFDRLFSSGRVLCSGAGGVLDLVDIADGTSVFVELTADWHRVSSDGNRVAVCDSDGKVRVYDVDDGDSVELNPTVDDCDVILPMPSFEKFVVVDTDGNLVIASSNGDPDVIVDSGDAYPGAAMPDSTAFVYHKRVDRAVGDVTKKHSILYSREIGATESVLLPLEYPHTLSMEPDDWDFLRPSVGSDAFFAVIRDSDFVPPELHRVALDGGSDTVVGQIYHDMSGEWGTSWDVDEANGRAYLTGPGRKPVVVDLATLENRSVDLGGTLGYLAPDRSGALTLSENNAGLITWVPFDTMTPVYLHRYDPEFAPAMDAGGKGMMLSPDSRYVLYSSLPCGADCQGNRYTRQLQMLLYDLKPDAE